MGKNWLLGVRLNHHNHIEFNEHNKGIGFKPNTHTRYDKKNVCLSAAIISISLELLSIYVLNSKKKKNEWKNNFFYIYFPTEACVSLAKKETMYHIDILCWNCEHYLLM